MGKPVTLRPLALLRLVVVLIGRVLAVASVRRGAVRAVPVHGEVVVLVADEQQRPVAVAHLLVPIHVCRAPVSMYVHNASGKKGSRRICDA
jgi:hypothetical protein